MRKNLQRRNVTHELNECRLAHAFSRDCNALHKKHTTIFLNIMNITNLDDKMSSERCTVCLLAGDGVSRVAASFGCE